jgi:exodeoxyribonuclease VII large subunit
LSSPQLFQKQRAVTPMINSSDNHPYGQHVYEVSELNSKIKELLEEAFPFIWISGEISNLRIPASGHCYFTLKDRRSQIGAVVFRTQVRALKFRPEDGMSIVGLGRISVYEPRGAYQVIFEYMEPKGVGALQIEFERLKQKLADEGLFDDAHKRPLPLLPKKISLVTSPTGAAVRDFINVARRRFPNLPLEVVPVTVQGDRSPQDVRDAIDLLNRIATTDVIVLCRGGGSIEDLCAFNDESLARTIFASPIPIVSAIGHETDFTIADFVADLRAPTPSAAAEIVVPSKNELKTQLDYVNQKIYQIIYNRLKLYYNKVNEISNRITHPKRRLEDLSMRLDDYWARMLASIKESLSRQNERVALRHEMLLQVSPGKAVAGIGDRLTALQGELCARMQLMIRDRQAVISSRMAMLDALNPMAILQRGYSITRTLPQQRIVRSADAVNVGQSLEILLGSGRLGVSVDDRTNE